MAKQTGAPPTSQPVLCDKENTGQVSHNTHTRQTLGHLHTHTLCGDGEETGGNPDYWLIC